MVDKTKPNPSVKPVFIETVSGLSRLYDILENSCTAVGWTQLTAKPKYGWFFLESTLGLTRKPQTKLLLVTNKFSADRIIIKKNNKGKLVDESRTDENSF